jgi:hypothetical protein
MNMLSPRDLIGSWVLVEWRIDYPDGRPATHPFGEDAIGLLVYGADGWMSATMSCRRRTALTAVSAVKADDASRAQAFQEYLTYGGRWHIEGGRIAHDVELSLNPALIGTRQWREAQLHDDQLLLAADEPIGGGRMRRHQIRWRRP